MITICVYARIGRAAHFVGVNEIIDDLTAKFARKIVNREGETEDFRHTCGIGFGIFVGTRSIGEKILWREKSHHNTAAIVACVAQQKTANAAIYATAHSDQNGFFTHGYSSQLNCVNSPAILRSSKLPWRRIS